MVNPIQCAGVQSQKNRNGAKSPQFALAITLIQVILALICPQDHFVESCMLFYVLTKLTWRYNVVIQFDLEVDCKSEFQTCHIHNAGIS